MLMVRIPLDADRRRAVPLPGRRHYPHRRWPLPEPSRRASALDLFRYTKPQGRGL